jgi:hypothetical protein
MSWEIFKQNILNVANNPEGIPDIDTIADLYAREYDAAIKRGGDSVNNVCIKRGNVRAMRELFRAALQKGLNSKAGYDLVGEMGQGVLAYWSGATLNEFPIPKIPATGATQNIGVISNIVVNPGSWQPVVNADPPPLPNEAFKLTQEEIEAKKEELEDAKKQDNPMADDYVAKTQFELDSGENLSVLVDEPPPKPRFVAKKILTLTPTQYTQTNTLYASGPIGDRIVQAATADLGILEGKNSAGKFINSGGAKNPNGQLQVGAFGRIDYMHQLNGLNNLKQLQDTGDGYFWCASAVGTWWKEAGITGLDFRIPWVPAWVSWAQKNGLWSATPVVGAAIIYKGGDHLYCHIGIVKSVINGVVTTIEGNTTGAGFNRNGCTVAIKQPNLKRVAGYVIPPGSTSAVPTEPPTK